MRAIVLPFLYLCVTVSPHLASAQSPVRTSSSCSGLQGLENTGNDASVALQQCIDQAKPGSVISFKPGAVYTLANPVIVSKSLIFTTSGLGKDAPSCDGSKHALCASLFRSPVSSQNSDPRPVDTLFAIAADGVSIHHLILDGVSSLSSKSGEVCSERSLVKSLGSSTLAIERVVFKNNACGNAVDIRNGAHIAIRDSLFARNGSASIASSGLKVSSSRDVDVVANLFINNLNYDVHANSCQDCTIRANVAWHTTGPNLQALAAFRVIGGDVSVSENIADCGGTGCAADFVLGDMSSKGSSTSSDIKVFDNVSLNPQTGYTFGRGATINLIDNLTIGDERVCDGTPFYGFSRLPGARIVVSGSRLKPGHISEISETPRRLTRESISHCTMKQTSALALPRARWNEPAIKMAIDTIFKRELSRAPQASELAKFGKMIARAELTLTGLTARARGLAPLTDARRDDETAQILPQRCFPNIDAGESQEVCVEQLGEDGLVGGDINLPGIFSSSSRGQIHAKGLGYTFGGLWTGGIVPYEIGTEFPAESRATINAAISSYNSYSARTKVRFVPHTNQSNYIKIAYEPFQYACGDSRIGMVGGMQKVRINATPGGACVLRSDVLHELGHALGLLHEHQRSDRERFIKINFQNSTRPANDYNFKPLSPNDGFTSLQGYDIASVMHYSSYTSSRNGLPVFVTINLQLIPVASSLSPTDITSLTLLYARETAPTPIPTTKPTPAMTPTRAPTPTKTPTPIPATAPTLSAMPLTAGSPLYAVEYQIAPLAYQIDFAIMETDRLLTSAQMAALPWSDLTNYYGNGSPAYLPRKGLLPLPTSLTGKCLAVRARTAYPGSRTSEFTYASTCRAETQ